MVANNEAQTMPTPRSGTRRSAKRSSPDLQQIERRCRDLGLRLTIQRRAVLESFLDAPDHPSADQVYTAVCRRLPGVSRTTIYRTLDQFVRLGLLTKACHPGSAVRYDNRTDIHHHLVCLACGRIIDIDNARLDSIRLPDTKRFDFEVRDFGVHIRGLCGPCRRKSRKEGRMMMRCSHGRLVGTCRRRERIRCQDRRSA
jgi:Fe2+ or Zn2+ uptake regulation protein